MELQKHINLKHRVNSKADGSIKCRNCGKMFETKHNSMNHRKKDHSSSVAPCKNYLNKNCNFSAELCWWKHSEKEDQTIECFVFGNKFDSKSSMMNLRKLEHKLIIKTCNQYKEMKCRFDDKSCWFKHEEEEIKSDEFSDFWNGPQAKEPP